MAAPAASFDGLQRLGLRLFQPIQPWVKRRNRRPQGELSLMNQVSDSGDSGWLWRERNSQTADVMITTRKCSGLLSKFFLLIISSPPKQALNCEYHISSTWNKNKSMRSHIYKKYILLYRSTPFCCLFTPSPATKKKIIPLLPLRMQLFIRECYTQISLSQLRFSRVLWPTKTFDTVQKKLMGLSLPWSSRDVI